MKRSVQFVLGIFAVAASLCLFIPVRPHGGATGRRWRRRPINSAGGAKTSRPSMGRTGGSAAERVARECVAAEHVPAKRFDAQFPTLVCQCFEPVDKPALDESAVSRGVSRPGGSSRRGQLPPSAGPSTRPSTRPSTHAVDRIAAIAPGSGSSSRPGLGSGISSGPSRPKLGRDQFRDESRVRALVRRKPPGTRRYRRRWKSSGNRRRHARMGNLARPSGRRW